MYITTIRNQAPPPPPPLSMLSRRSLSSASICRLCVVYVQVKRKGGEGLNPHRPTPPPTCSPSTAARCAPA